MAEEPTEKELKAYLADLIHFMESSASSYDMGYEGEAQRLSVAIKTIVEGTENSGSLLEMLGIDFYYYDNSPEYNPSLGLPFTGLALYVRKGIWEGFIPRLGANPGVKTRKASFEEWWNKTVIVEPEMGLSLTRKDIIYSVSNTEGVLLTDPKLNQTFNELILRHPIGWVDEKKGVQRELLQVEFASVRQMAYELLKALQEESPEYFDERADG